MDQQQERGGSSLNTFLFGVLVGVLASLLFTTKKGRKLLRVITDESVDRLSKWEDMIQAMQDEVEEDESVMGEDVEDEVKAISAPKKSEKIEIDSDEDEPLISEMPDEDELPHIKRDKLEKKVLQPASQRGEQAQDEREEESTAKKKSRRLFKGIRKKSS
ncbi:MAG TPA: YtxH domain-containing protein [Patescibacteria group bacterium]|nr:YtxH domain-containing protein [Patescibacteria group bacterium]